MYAKNALAISGALLTAVAAIPMVDKRDMVWVTETDVVIETVMATETVWVNPSETTVAAAANDPPAHYGHGHGHRTSTVQSFVTVPPASSPESSYVAPEPSSTYVAPTSSSIYVAPTTSSVYVPPTTSSVYVPPTTSTPVYVAPTTSSSVYVAPVASSAPAAASPSGYSGSAPSDSYTGDITYYAIGLGSCGMTNTDSEAVVAIPEDIMANGINPNANPKCGQTITISYAGKTTQAKIVDTCGGCFANSIDLSPTLFKEVAPEGDGRVHDVTWWFDN